MQLPFIIMRFIFSLAGEEDIEVARYLQGILTKLKGKAGLLDNEDLSEPLQFEEILFLRIAFEYIKMYKVDRSQEFIDLLDDISIGFEEYNQIFNHLLSTPEESDSGDSADRLIFSEWVKFSLQLPIEDEVTRRNLVTLMFGLISHVDNSFRDYQHLLKYGRYMIREQDMRSLELALEEDDEYEDVTEVQEDA